jgi:hypothetical protein
LPPGVKAVGSFEKAARDVTPTRERVSINGLWRWQPGRPDAVERLAGQVEAKKRPSA